MNRNIDLKIWQGQAGYADIEATRSRLTFTTDLVEAAQVVDLVIEAVPDIKIDIYKKLAAVMPEEAILATISSTLRSMFSKDAITAAFYAQGFENMQRSAFNAHHLAHTHYRLHQDGSFLDREFMRNFQSKKKSD